MIYGTGAVFPIVKAIYVQGKNIRITSGDIKSEV